MDPTPTALDLTTPAWLAGLAALPIVVWVAAWGLTGLPRRRVAAITAVRCAVLALVLVALAGPGWWRAAPRPFVVFALDRSQSVGDAGAAAAEAFLDATLAARGDTPAAFLTFAANPGTPSPERAAGTRPPADDRDRLGTDLEAAIAAAAAAVPPGASPRIVLLTDGVATTGDARAAAARAGVPLYTVPLPRRADPNVQLADLIVPAQVREDEPFSAEVVVTSTREDFGELDVFVNGLRVPGAGGKLAVAPGVRRVPVTVRPSGEGRFMKLLANVRGFSQDRDPDDNRAAALVYCVGRPKVLVVTGDDPRTADPLANALAAQGLAVDPVRGAEGLPPTVAECQPYDLIVLSDLDLTQPGVTRAKLEALGRYVRDLGGGLLVVGGERSFGPGGYARSPLEDLLPVRCDVRDAREQPTLALVLVIDKSGSMRDEGKMDAAREAAAAAAGALGPNDQIGVVAFDQQPVWVSELRPAAVQRAGLPDQLRGVIPDGGTHMLPGLTTAVEALRGVGAAARFKHVILISDGEDDGEQKSATADYHALADRAASSGIIITTLAVGRGANKPLLRELAARGGGKSYETDEAREVPTIVLKTAAAAGRRSVREPGPFHPVVARAVPALAGVVLDTAPPLSGYTLTRPRPGAELVLTVGDGDPLLAWWPVGYGTCAAFTSDAKLRWAREWADDWADYPKYWAQVARRTARPPEPPGVEVQVRRDGYSVHVTLDRLGPDGRFANGDRVTLGWIESDVAGAETRTVPLAQTAPGRYAGRFAVDPRPGEYLLRLAVEPAGGAEPLVLHRGLVIGYPEERRLGPPDTELLRELAASTGGVYDPAPEAVFAAGGPEARRRVPLAPYLLALAALLFVLDVALRRLPTRHPGA